MAQEDAWFVGRCLFQNLFPQCQSNASQKSVKWKTGWQDNLVKCTGSVSGATWHCPTAGQQPMCFTNSAIAQCLASELELLLCRFAVDSMQATFLDEAGGEKHIDPATQETTLVHHIFGGRLQSQV